MNTHSRAFYEQDLYNQNNAHKQSVTLVRSKNDKLALAGDKEEEHLSKEERVKRQILHYRNCKIQEQQNTPFSKTISHSPLETPTVENRWITEHRDQYVYYVEKRRKNSNKNVVASCQSTSLSPTAFINYTSSPFIQQQPIDSSHLQTNQFSSRNNGNSANTIVPPTNISQNTLLKTAKTEEKNNLNNDYVNSALQRSKSAMEADSIESDSSEEDIEEAVEQRNFKSPNSRLRQSHPPFHNYGWNNTKPVIDEHYLKTWNINPLHNAHVYDNVISRREKSHQYDGWKNISVQETKKPLNSDEFAAEKIEQFSNIGSNRTAEKRRGSSKTTKQIFVQKHKSRRDEDEMEDTSFIQDSQKSNFNAYPASNFNAEISYANKKRESRSDGINDLYNPSKYATNTSPSSIETSTNTDDLQEIEYDETQYINFEPYTREEFNPKFYKHLPPQFMSYIVPAGRQTIHSEDIRECFKTHR